MGAVATRKSLLDKSCGGIVFLGGLFYLVARVG